MAEMGNNPANETCRVCWQDVLQRLGFGPGRRLGEQPVYVGEPIPRDIMLRLEIAYAVQTGCPIRVHIQKPLGLPGSQMEVEDRVEEVQSSSLGANDYQDQQAQGSETTQEHLFCSRWLPRWVLGSMYSQCKHIPGSQKMGQQMGIG